VLEGSIELVLDETSVILKAGDLVVNPGINHGWRTHDAPATIVFTSALVPSEEPVP
jgi:quercetin dioxygenase-like cupin family protein